eukprot:CAMPEP_0114234178 /NCGR_PEP_ID=MMETSP0058-20121206/5575_1 /TAXON_ID=36894 /ORGANISM="Pyramimonas parkeae, CCMP726" /LENGTH=43 /DNA_ID= /DNA_START= /DNA_END= /DNA_ORIENTATION=
MACLKAWQRVSLKTIDPTELFHQNVSRKLKRQAQKEHLTSYLG